MLRQQSSQSSLGGYNHSKQSSQTRDMNILGLIYQRELAALRQTVKQCEDRTPVPVQAEERERWDSFNQNQTIDERHAQL